MGYKVWQVAGYPLTAPAPSIAQTARMHLGSAAAQQGRPTQFNSRNPSPAKSLRKIPCAQEVSAHQPLGLWLKPLWDVLQDWAMPSVLLVPGQDQDQASQPLGHWQHDLNTNRAKWVVFILLLICWRLTVGFVLPGGFLIPYLIMLIAEGMPLLYLELAVGQRMRQGSIGAWKIISPYLCGVGMFSVSIFVLQHAGNLGDFRLESFVFQKNPGRSSGLTGFHQAEQNQTPHGIRLSCPLLGTGACCVGSGFRGVSPPALRQTAKIMLWRPVLNPALGAAYTEFWLQEHLPNKLNMSDKMVP